MIHNIRTTPKIMAHYSVTLFIDTKFRNESNTNLCSRWLL